MAIAIEGAFTSGRVNGGLTISTGDRTTVVGNLIIVAITYDVGTGLTVADNKGNTFTLAVGPINNSGNTDNIAIYYCNNIVGAGAGHHVTVVVAGSAFICVSAFEVSGQDKVTAPQANSAVGTASTYLSGAITPSKANSVLAGGLTINTGSSAAWGTLGSWTDEGSQTNGSSGGVIILGGIQISSIASTQFSATKDGSTQYSGVIVSFGEAAAATSKPNVMAGSKGMTRGTFKHLGGV